MKGFGLIVILLAVATAEIIFDGACPAVEPVKDFDLSAYSGLWYQIKKVPLPHEDGRKCGTAFYTLDGDSLKLKYSVVVDGVETFVLGVANKADDADDAAKLVLNINIGKNTRVEPLWILATDYSNYAISYSCKYDEKTDTHKLGIWVLSRTKGLEGDAKAKVDNIIRGHFAKIDPSKFIAVDLSEDACKFQRSSVYAAHVGH